MQSVAPQRALTKLAGMLANSKIVWLKNILIRYFIFRFSRKLNFQAAIESNPYAYDSFNALFTRQLKSELRPIAATAGAIVSPADGTIAQLGYLDKDLILTAKGKDFRLPELLGCHIDGNRIDPKRFEHGAFVTIYLAPPDYHRVHMPVSGSLQQMLYVPGKLFSVNQATAAAIPNLFGRNERVINLFATEYGNMVVILVGAMLVGHIGTSWAGIVNAEHGYDPLVINYHQQQQGIFLKKGEELGYFRMGSTAIVIFEQAKINWQSELRVGAAVKFGQAIGHTG